MERLAWMLRGEAPVDLSDRRFFEGLTLESTELLQARHAFNTGDRESAISNVLDYYRTRSRPRFFVDREHFPSLARRLSEDFPDEARELLEWCDLSVREGLPVYEQRAPLPMNVHQWESLRALGRDVLYQLRPHRFGFAPKFAIASLLEPSMLPPLEAVLRAWQRFVRQDVGASAYFSNLIVIYRIVALHWTFAALLAVDASQSLLFEIVKTLHSDIRYLSVHFGQSAANNHKLADGFGLWYGAQQFPELKGAPDWRLAGEALWLQELDRQFYDDGSGFEQSTHYHELACEMVTAYLLLKERNGEPAPDKVKVKAELMLGFQIALAGGGGEPIQIGDGTEDPLFPLSAADGPDLRSLTAMRTRLFDQGTNRIRADSPGRAYWLLEELPEPAQRTDPPCFYDVGGYFLLPDSQLRGQLSVRTGPAPGTEVFAGHMHADQLSVFLHLDSKAVIVDGGTYTYSPGLDEESWKWRSHFLGRHSHSGLVIDGEDPLGPVHGPFRDANTDLRVASSRAGTSDSLYWVEGRILGDSSYSEYVRGAIHVFGEYWVIYDLMPRDELTRRAAVQLLLAQSTKLKVATSSRVEVDSDGRGLQALFCGLEAPTLLEGSESPLAGWQSLSYGKRAPAPLLRFPWKAGAQAAVQVLDPAMRLPLDGTVTIETSGSWIAIRMGTPDDYDTVLIVRDELLESEVSIWQITFAGRHLWFRVRDNELRALRWNEASVFESLGTRLRARGSTEAVLHATFEGADLRLHRGDDTNVTLDRMP